MALDEFCQTMDTAIVPYLPQLVTKLIEVLQNGTPGAQESAMSALSSAAAAAGREFEPYAAPLLQLLHHCMQQTAAEMIPTRCADDLLPITIEGDEISCAMLHAQHL